MDVRPHAWTAAGLLAAGAVLSLVPSVGGTFALLGGATLALSCVLLWYLPSFAKRALVGPPWLPYVGIVLFLLAALLAVVRDDLAEAAAALGLVHLAALLLASVAWGAPWRSGVPFWREGPHVAGDRAAAIVLGVGLCILALAGVLPGSMTRAWTLGLAIVALGALAHYVPRARGRAPIPAAVVAGAAIAAVALVAPFPRALAPAGLLVACAGVLAGRATKAPGARLRDAAPPLAGAIAALVAGLLALPGALAVAAGLALLGLCLLTLPVVFNQRPWSAAVVPATIAALAIPAAALVSILLAAALTSVAVLLALAALAPLREPRRAC